MYVRSNNSSNKTTITAVNQTTQYGTGVFGVASANIESVGVYGQADNGTNAYGVRGLVSNGEFTTPTTGIGGYFQVIDTGYGVPTNSYSVQLQDGTEGLNKVLLSTTSDGKANWSNVLTGLTNVRSTTISATTYQNLPVSGLTQGTNITITNNGSGNYTINSSSSVSLGTVYTTGNNLNFI
jgi:hypothetical protein